MKKALLFSAIVLLSVGAYAQKKGKVKPFNPTTGLATKSDSLSYALGQNITNGLKQHLTSIGVLKDTTAASLITDYDKQLAEADEAGKAKLEKEYQTKLAEAKKANEIGLNLFVKGLEDALRADAEKNKYNAGIGVGNQLSTISEKFEEEMLDGNKLNKEAFVYSVVSSIKGQESIMEGAEQYLQKAATEMQEAAQLKAAEELKAKHGERISEGVKFLADNKTKEGVTTLPSGLQYVVVEEGAGATPTSKDQVTVHYEGRLLDGTVFDSSYKRGEPATFGVTQVIKGWTEALQLMPEGSKWTVYIPYDLAYGERDSGTIPPFSTLVFDIELINIAK